MNALNLFFITSTGLCLLLHGQENAFSQSELTGKRLSAIKSANLLSQGSGDSLEIEMLNNASHMTISQSYQSISQATEDLGTRFDIAEIDEDLSETLKNNESPWSRIIKDNSEIQNRALTPLNIIIATTATLLLVVLNIIRIRSKRS